MTKCEVFFILLTQVHTESTENPDTHFHLFVSLEETGPDYSLRINQRLILSKAFSCQESTKKFISLNNYLSSRSGSTISPSIKWYLMICSISSKEE